MTEIINALWELRTVFVFLLGIAGGLVLASLMVMARNNEEPEGHPTITIPPVADEPMGDMVDVKELMRRYE